MPHRDPVRIANVSGFYGDDPHAMRAMVEAGPVDVLTGDYLAELTMLILWKARRRDPSAGYAHTFLPQLESVLGTCLDRGTKIVVNAGGLNPGGLAARVKDLASRLGLKPAVAWVRGDDFVDRVPALLRSGVDLTHLDTGRPLTGDPVTANAYLGGWGITEALAQGADIVITGRVTDASLVTGPAAWWHDWANDDWDALAGAVVAGHVVECGPQACGGNYPFLEELADLGYPGFPIAEVAHDGSCLITKQESTGGGVTVGTVTAQLLYEIADPAYANPDVIARFDTIAISQDGQNRVRLSGTKGLPPTDRLKAAINLDGGYRNTVTFVLTGADIEAKAAAAERHLFERLGGRGRFDEVDVDLIRSDRDDAPRTAEATARLSVTVKSPDEAPVGRSFSNTATAMAVASYAGLHTTTPPRGATAFGIYWPSLIPRAHVHHEVVLPDGSVRSIASPPLGPSVQVGPVNTSSRPSSDEDEVSVERLGLIVGGRSGDKGGNANVGLWAWTDLAYQWLLATLDATTFRILLPEADDLVVDRYVLGNLRAVNFVVRGWLGDGVAACTRPDPQAKGLAEYIRSRRLAIPVSVLASASTGTDGPGRSPGARDCHLGSIRQAVRE